MRFTFFLGRREYKTFPAKVLACLVRGFLQNYCQMPEPGRSRRGVGHTCWCHELTPRMCSWLLAASYILVVDRHSKISQHLNCLEQSRATVGLIEIYQLPPSDPIRPPPHDIDPNYTSLTSFSLELSLRVTITQRNTSLHSDRQSSGYWIPYQMVLESLELASQQHALFQ